MSIFNEGCMRKDMHIHIKKHKMILLFYRMKMISLVFLFSHTSDRHVFDVKASTCKLCICAEMTHLLHLLLVRRNVPIKMVKKNKTNRWIKCIMKRVDDEKANFHHESRLL